MYTAWIVVPLWFLGSAVQHAQDTHPRCLWPGPAQLLMDRASPPDSVLFPVGSGTGKLCYSRPSMRGRRIFGELVEYGKLWRTGANEPTQLHLPVGAAVAGLRLEPGTYVLMTIPGPDRWTVVVNTTTASTPIEMFSALVEVGRTDVVAETIAVPIEQFTIRATDDLGGAGLILEWERVRIRMPIVAR